MNVEVLVCERNAIYVDDSRITNRHTKWGIRATLALFACKRRDVVDECLKRGFLGHVRCIDTEPYLSAARAALQENSDEAL